MQRAPYKAPSRLSSLEISKSRIVKQKAATTKPQGGITALRVVEGQPKRTKALKERIDKDMKRLNIAYGSNLNLSQMSRRCPTASVYGRGFIKDYRLLFKGTPKNAYATIEPYKGGRVPVIVWELQPEDEKALDYYEGFPNFYYKKDLKVELESGEAVTAMVYIMTNKIKDRIHLNLPGPGYLKTVKEGYVAAGFDVGFIEEALMISAETLSENEIGSI